MQRAHSFQQIEDDEQHNSDPKKKKASSPTSPLFLSRRNKKKSPKAASSTAAVANNNHNTTANNTVPRRKSKQQHAQSARESPRRRRVNNSSKGIMAIADDAVQKPKRSSGLWRNIANKAHHHHHHTANGNPKSRTTSHNTSLASLDATPDEDDPVMALFQARNTQKVRFSLGGVEPKERGRARPPPLQAPPNANGASSSGPSLQRQDSGKLSPASSSERGSFNIKKFMKGTLFGSTSSGSSSSNNGGSGIGGSGKGKDGSSSISQSDEFDLEVAKEIQAASKQNKDMVWSTQEKAEKTTEAEDGRLLDNATTFIEDGDVRATVIKLLNKARRAQFLHYRYSYAVKCYVRALEILADANYPNSHPTVVKTMATLNSAHFSNASHLNSANIVKLGIKYEDAGELVRALKMYTIAYRIRRDNLSASHPSLVVLLNMLGSIQIKRGELQEAMSIYELALKDTSPPAAPTTSTSPMSSDGDESTDFARSRSGPMITNYLTRAITYREMGTIYEQYGETLKALNMYHKSLDCMAEYKGLASKPFLDEVDQEGEGGGASGGGSGGGGGKLMLPSEREILEDLEETRLSNKPTPTNTRTSPRNSPRRNNNSSSNPNGDEDKSDDGMELTFGDSKKGKKIAAQNSASLKSGYDIFFPVSLLDDAKKRKKRLSGVVGKNKEQPVVEKQGDYTDVDIALTIHRIAQLHRASEEYHLAVPAFNVSLRGMKYALGKSHPNVAAILGNIGNLQKEMGDMDSAYSTYQQVLAIESYRLGLSHPDVVVTLHNIATIDAARGNHEHALSLYTQVVSLQRKLFGEDHESVAVTSACMGDVYERLGDSKGAVECYEEALRIKIAALGRHSLEVARLLHKLGKLSVGQSDYHLAQSYLSKAALVYRLNKLRDDDEWVVDVKRDEGNVNAAIELGHGVDFFEC